MRPSVIALITLLIGLVCGVAVTALVLDHDAWLKAEVLGPMLGAFSAAMVGLIGAFWLDRRRYLHQKKERLRHLYGELLTLRILTAPLIGFFTNFDNFLNNEVREKEGRVLISDPRKSPPDFASITERLAVLASIDPDTALELSYAVNAVKGCLKDDAEAWFGLKISAGKDFAKTALSGLDIILDDLKDKLSFSSEDSCE